MRSLNWSHAIIGFLIGVALVLYVRTGNEAAGSGSDQGSYEVVEVSTE